MIVIFKLCIAILGLTLPGYMLARGLRLENSWVAAFPLSALFMVETVIIFSLTGISIQFSTMAGALLLSTLVCGAIIKRQPEPLKLPQVEETSKLPRYFRVAVLLVASAVLFSVAYRTTLFPLRGLDTSFRWEGLARAMLQHQSLDFYPPVSASDFSIYLYPDGIPPLVATVYWWIYASLGVPVQNATSISIVLQLAATLALIFYGARHLFGCRTAWFALLAAAASPLLISGFAIGQETGFTALAVAGQLCFSWAAVRKPRTSTVVVVALFAALGALARDYGPALALTGFVVLAWHQETRRYLPVFILVTVLLSAPWYIRSWALTGNPFFSHQIPGGFTVNTTHAAIMEFYKGVYSFGQFDQARWLNLIKQLCAGGFLAIVTGIPFAMARWRESAPVLISALVVILLWIFSVSQTAGGVIFSTRVLTPAIVALALTSGLALSKVYTSEHTKNPFMRACLIICTLVLVGYSLASTLNYPRPSRFLYVTDTSTPLHSVQQALVDRLEATDLPPTGVLTDLPFVAEIMKKSSRFRPVMYWSPEVAFVLDQSLEPQEIQRRLSAQNIRLVMIDQESPNNGYLARSNFFRSREAWRVLFAFPNEAAIFYYEAK